MAAMKNLHIEYGEVVYQSEVQRVIPRTALLDKTHELADRYGNEILPLLNDIYDEICDYPEDWEVYGATDRQIAAFPEKYTVTA
jgi:hypothetical protein